MKEQNFFEHIDLIKSTETEPQVINLFDLNEIEEILKFYKQMPVSIFNEKQNIKKKHWILGFNKKMDEFIISKINSILKNWKIDNMYSKENALGIFHESYSPIKIHADTGKDKKNLIYKQILIPLTDTGDTVLFEPRWYGPSTSFTIKKEELENKNGYNFKSSDHIGDDNFDVSFYNKYLNHETYDNLKGLKVKKLYNWKLGEALIFDRSFIHCASDLKKPKIGLTIFLNKD